MTHCNALNVKLSNSQLNKLKSGIKNCTEVTLTRSPNAIGGSNDETIFPQKFLLSDKKILRLGKLFVNGLSANIKLSKTQLSKMVQLGGFLGRPLGPLLKTGLLLMKNVLNPLTKKIIIPLGSTTAASAEAQGYIKKIVGSGMCLSDLNNRF